MGMESSNLARQARKAFHSYLGINGYVKGEVLKRIIENLELSKKAIISENQKDLFQAEKDGLSKAMLDRLTLDAGRIDKIKEAVAAIIGLPDPIGQVEYSTNTPEGLVIHQERTPIGVVLIIFESRPNIVPEIAALTLKSGNACILRGGKEAIHSNIALGQVLAKSLKEVGLDEALVQVVNTADKNLVKSLLKANEHIDMVIPRGGKGLIQFVCQESHIPVVKHDDGICHTYIHHDAEKQMAIDIAVNAKASRPGVCNAMETLLIHKDVTFIQEVLSALKHSQVELRVDKKLYSQTRFANLASEQDWRTEYLDLVLSVKQVDGLEQAIDWINNYGSHHSDAIITSNLTAAQHFQNKVDSACVFVNSSTRFADGGCFGLGSEVGISTQKLHARGPMGLKDLTSLKYKILGQGQIRL